MKVRPISVVGYTLTNTYPSCAETDLLNIKYFDDYGFIGYSGWDAEAGHSYTFIPEQGNAATATSVTGLPTGSKSRVIGQTPSSTWLNAVQYYDIYYRPDPNHR